jgi:DNA-directed RNA polymerase specialized sigma24 family protein
MPLANVTPQSLGRSYRTVLLLAGSAARAEDAMFEAIHAMDPDQISEEALVRGAITAAVTAGRAAPAKRRDSDPASSALPPELRRVLRLPTDLRHCFVLRILAGLSREDCAQLLTLSIPAVDERTCDAARRLAGVRMGWDATFPGQAFLPRPASVAAVV